MTVHKKKDHVPVFKKSILALTVMGICATVNAQETDVQTADTDDVEIVEVKGMRGSLFSAQALKRNASTVVDSITSDDIGALPDRSVLEAIQRLPGISIEMFAGPDDPDHFSVEGSGAIIRGLANQTRSEFNGRDSFSANSGRGLSFNDVSPELMGGVDVYKNQTADMIEGGIGGTVSLRTRKPFDSDERVIAFNADYSYGSIAKEGSPTFSILYSDSWKTDAGKFGLLLNYADSELIGESHGIQSDAYVTFYARDIAGAERFVGDQNDGIVYVPQGGNALGKTDTRNRKGFSTALQWENTDETFLATLQYIRSDASLSWHEQSIKYQGGFFDIDRRETRPLQGTEFVFDDQGLFESGTLVNGTDGWRAGDQNADRVARAWGSNSRSQWGHKQQFDSRVKQETSLVEDFALNLRWLATENLELTADMQYIKANTSDDDVTVHTAAFMTQNYDVSNGTPVLTLSDPWGGYRDANPDLFQTYPSGASSDGVTDNRPDGFTDYPGFSGDPAGDGNYFQDPNNYFWRSAMDHYQRSEGDSVAARLDGKYFLEDAGIFTVAHAGVRYAKREQTVRNTGWNWGSTSPEFRGNVAAGWLSDVESQAGDYETYDWSDFYGGGVVNVPGNTTFMATEEFVRSITGANPERAPFYSDTNVGEWVPLPRRTQERDGVTVDAEYGIFSPGEINTTTETNKAIFLKLDFEGDDELRYSGNIGFRYIELDRESIGSLNFPNFRIDEGSEVPEGVNPVINAQIVADYLNQQVADGLYADFGDAKAADENKWVSENTNYLSLEERAFADGTEKAGVEDSTFKMFLPSFNIKVSLTDDVVMRFALSKAVAFPDMGDVKNDVGIGAETVFLRPQFDVDVEPDPEENLIQFAGVNRWTGGGGNPHLAPMESVQYDFSLEWYFADVGSITATVFHKNLKNFFTQGSTNRDITNPTTGETRNVYVTTTVNGDKAKMDGLEVAYQQFFDMLPAPFDGFGIQANYTLIDASGVANNAIEIEDEGFFGNDFNDTGIRVKLDSIPLEGQSKHTANLVTMYEKEDWSARLAYNWRSRYLLTVRDVISKAPLWNDDRGSLDGSIYYTVNENISVGFQGTNLLDTETKTIMLLNDDLLEAPRSFFKSDRRLSFVVKGSF